MFLTVLLNKCCSYISSAQCLSNLIKVQIARKRLILKFYKSCLFPLTQQELEASATVGKGKSSKIHPSFSSCTITSFSLKKYLRFQCSAWKIDDDSE